MATEPNGQIIRAGRGAERIGDWLNSQADQIQLATPEGMNGVRMARVFTTEIQRVPGLIQCTPTSLLAGFLQATQCGLEIGAHLGQAYLIPFKVRGTPTATLILGYRGLVQLAYRSGIIDDVSAEAVRAQDKFSYRLGTSPEVTHEKGEGKDLDDITHAYAIAWLRGATRPKISVLTREEIEKVRRSSRAASKSDSPWNKWFGEMAAKTALRRICKTLPQTPQTRPLHSAVMIDEQADANLDQVFDVTAIDVPTELDHDPAAGEVSAEEERRAFGDSGG